MKKIALFILLLFAFVQVIPGLQAMFSDQVCSVIFNVDGRKTEKKPLMAIRSLIKNIPASASFPTYSVNGWLLHFTWQKKYFRPPAWNN